MSAAPEPVVPSDEAEWDDAVVEAPGPQPDLEAFRLRLRTLREKAIRAGLLPARGPAAPPAAIPPAEPPPAAPVVATPLAELPPVSPAFEVPPGATVKERLERFAAWAQARLGGGQLLMIDEYGDLLWGPQAPSGLVLSTLMAWNAASRASVPASAQEPRMLHQHLANGDLLTVLPCPTRLGLLQLAVVQGRALDETEAVLLRQTLTALMEVRD